MSTELGSINRSTISNLFARYGQASYYVCACCMDSFKGAEPTVFGKAGCVMMDITKEDVAKGWAPYSIKSVGGGPAQQIMRCLRCSYINRPCYAFPKGVDVDWEELQGLVKAVQDAFDELDANDGPTQDNAAATKAYKMAVMELAVAAQPYVAALKKYEPHDKCLFLSSGALTSDQDPHSKATLSNTGRSKKDQEVRKRAHELEVEQRVEERVKKAKTGAGGRRKEIKVPSSAIGLMEDQVRRIKEKIESLTALHAGANAKQKRKLTAQMKEERKEVERLEKEIEEALEGRE